EGGDHTGGFVVQRVVVAACGQCHGWVEQQLNGGVHPRCGHTDGYQGIHGGSTVACGFDGSAVEWPAAPECNGQRQCHGDPAPVWELEDGKHGNEEQRNGQDRRPDQPRLQFSNARSVIDLGLVDLIVRVTADWLVGCVIVKDGIVTGLGYSI